MGKYIVFCGYAGLKASLRLIKEYYKDLSRCFNKIYLDSIPWHVKNRGYYGRYLSPICNERPQNCPVDINTIFADFNGRIKDVGEGGALKSVYMLAKSLGCGFEIEIKKITVIQICIEICEYFGLDIYRLLSEGKIIVTEDPISVCKYLEKNGIVSQTIGHLSDSLDKIIADKEIIEYVNRPAKDEIFKVIKDERKNTVSN